MGVFTATLTGNQWQRRFLSFEEDASARPWQIPYLYRNGGQPGKKVTCIAAIHGDELNGVRMLHELAAVLEGAPLRGSLCLVPVANLMGYANHSRYLPDRRDLNRMFPGLRDGSEGARLAYHLWQQFIAESDYVIDVHSGSYNRWNFPHLRGNMKENAMRAWAAKLSGVIVLNSSGVAGSLRKEAGKAGKPVFLIEAGETGRFEKKIVMQGLVLLLKLLAALDLIDAHLLEEARAFLTTAVLPETPPGYYRKAVWQRATQSGLFIPNAAPGEHVRAGQLLGTITDLFGHKRAEIFSETDGFILGMHLHPQVVPGRALFHIAYDFRELQGEGTE
ncbi:MAG: succinylglutamate desuccinylase/aspartoacylase family protein [Turneriella sp.]|nr:succinylglutamate desuccinylase/aspartoacylase family protein [Leptospiraceae bacterium]MCX7631857.1 succinylglutamate desuccinylase/aspartoacylase family protein [Turneriella sp.]